MRDYLEEAIAIYNIKNGQKKKLLKLAGCVFSGTDKYKDSGNYNKADVFIFNNPYRKTNIDIVFYRGELFISDSYGETMDRNNINYIPVGSAF